MANSKPALSSPGERLAHQMKWTGYHQTKLSEATGLSVSYIGLLKKDSVESPSIQTMLSICQVLGCYVEWMMLGVEPRWLPGREMPQPVPSPDMRTRENRAQREKATSRSGEHESVKTIRATEMKLASSAPPPAKPNKYTR